MNLLQRLATGKRNSSGSSLARPTLLTGYGVNMQGAYYYTQVYPWINLIHQGVWDSTGHALELALPDANAGWLANVPNNTTAQFNTVFGQTTLYGYIPPGSYTVACTENFAITIVPNAYISSIVNGTNSATFVVADLGNSADYQIDLRIQFQNISGSTCALFKNLYIGKTSNKAAHDAGEIFDPLFIADLQGVNHIRAANWTGQNSLSYPDILTYALTPKESNRDWQITPYGVIVKLAKKLNCITWLNLYQYNQKLSYTAATGTNLFTSYDALAGTPTVKAHLFNENDPIVFAGYSSTIPSPLVQGVKYFAVNVTGTTFKVAATSGGAAITLTSSIASPDSSYNVNLVPNLLPFYQQIAAECYAADPTAVIVPEAGLEDWNNSYSWNFCNKVLSVSAGDINTATSAQSGMAWAFLCAWKAFETYYPRNQVIHMTSGQAGYFDKMNGGYNYVDTQGVYSLNATLKNILDCYACAPYSNGTPDGVERDDPVRWIVAAGGDTASDATWLGWFQASNTVWATRIATSVAASNAIKAGIRQVTYEGGMQFFLSNGLFQGPTTITIASPAIFNAGFGVAYNSFLIPNQSVTFTTTGALPTGITVGSNYYVVPGSLATATVTISNASPAVIGWTAHGRVAGEQVDFITGGTLPTGLSQNVAYFVSATGLTANSFQVSATNGGASINTSSAGSGTFAAETTTFKVAATRNGAAINTSGTQSGVHTVSGYTSDNTATGVRYAQWLASASAGTWASDWVQRVLKNNGVKNVSIYSHAGGWGASNNFVAYWGWKRAHQLPDNTLGTTLKSAALTL